MAGILPFGAVFIELYFIFTAIWENQFYYLFGFLFLVFIILIISCSQISIVMVYFQLCGEVTSQQFICTTIANLILISGLPLVVEELHRIGRFSPLHSRVFPLLFPDKIGNNGIRSDSPLHRVHRIDGFDILAFDGHNWFLCSLYIHQKDL